MISAAIIVRNAEKTIAKCLDSIWGQVDEIVVVFAGESTDKTVQKVNRYKGRKIKTYEFKWVDDFAAARNFAFSKCTGDWILWIDADDTLETESTLKELVKLADSQEKLGQRVDMFSFPYYYHKNKSGSYDSVLLRDRLIRRSIFTEEGAEWKYPVHEIIVIPDRKSNMMNAPQNTGKKYDVVHHPEHAQEDKFKRNTRLLLKQLKEYRDDPRTYTELGRNWYYSDHSKFRNRALIFYLKAITMDLIPVDRYIALHRIADIYREIGQYDLAKSYDHSAMSIAPNYADAYYGLAETEQLAGNPAAALSYIKAGDTTAPIDARIGFDPLDYTFDAHRIEATIHMSLGNWEEARNHTYRALEYSPEDETVNKMKVFIDEYIRRNSMSQAALMLAQDPQSNLEELAEGLPRYVFDPQEVRNAYFGPIHKTHERADIIFFCGPGLEPWHKKKMITEGIGGSETAVIYLYEMLTAAGYDVLVYADPGMYEAKGWYDYRRFTGDIPCDLFISWRRHWIWDEQKETLLKVLWCHDLNYGADMQDSIDKWDYICGVSYWHNKYLQNLYSIPEEKVLVFPNGIDLDRFSRTNIERNMNKFIYTSSPERGLPELFDIWPRIRRDESDELHIFYGFNNMEKLAKIQDPSLAAYQAMVQAKAKETPGVVMRGRVGQLELAEEFMSANMLLYPTNFTEVSCITVMEAQAAGCIPITSHHGALRENVAPEIPLVAGNNRSLHYQKRFMSTVEFLRDNVENAEYLRARGRELAEKRQWSIEHIEELMRRADSIRGPENIVG